MAGGLQRIKHHFCPLTCHILFFFITLRQADHALIVEHHAAANRVNAG